MRVFGRPIALIMVCSLALLCTACGSNNKGKIVGKWKITDPPDKTSEKSRKDYAKMSQAGFYMSLEFKPDGVLTIGLGSDKPDQLDFLRAMAPNNRISWDAKYKLQTGDTVEFYDLPKEMQSSGGGGLFGGADRVKVKISINGDTMSMTDKEGTGKLVRMK